MQIIVSYLTDMNDEIDSSSESTFQTEENGSSCNEEEAFQNRSETEEKQVLIRSEQRIHAVLDGYIHAMEKWKNEQIQQKLQLIELRTLWEKYKDEQILLEQELIENRTSVEKYKDEQIQQNFKLAEFRALLEKYRNEQIQLKQQLTECHTSLEKCKDEQVQLKQKLIGTCASLNKVEAFIQLLSNRVCSLNDKLGKLVNFDDVFNPNTPKPAVEVTLAGLPVELFMVIVFCMLSIAIALVVLYLYYNYYLNTPPPPPIPKYQDSFICRWGATIERALRTVW
ncbi:hypothetical protein Clacol_000051 [Clathrus columnatus]|uniref:Uncharacterized protein n=1 Tax=Clathrus columnatus TaxID=1419009 RepID=A0AAV4ZW69_9AGAM|nr:hypothetical protein Clacol_000051 [Clathrus columnatus]